MHLSEKEGDPVSPEDDAGEELKEATESGDETGEWMTIEQTEGFDPYNSGAYLVRRKR